MSYLIDSNCFLRLAEPNSPHRAVVLAAIKNLHSSGETLCYTPQVLAEFWNVCTRPASARGGLGLSTHETERKVRLIEKHCRLLPDNLAAFIRWRQIITDYDIKGVQVHDARIAASVMVHNIRYLLTFNTGDFERFKQITVVSPSDI